MNDTALPDTPRNRGDHDAPHASPITPAEDARTIALNRVSWGAVFAGVVVSLVTHLILNMIGIGIGAATLEPGTGDSPQASTFSIGAGIWFAVTGIIAALLGGYAAGRLAGQPKESSAGWHGLTTWALTTLIVFWLLTTTIGGLIGGTFSTLTNAMGGVASTVGAAAQTTAEVAAQEEGVDPFSAIQDAIQGVTGGAGVEGADPAATREAAVAAVRALVTGDPGQAEQAREEAAQAIADAQGIPLEEARNQVAEYEQQYQERAEQVGEQATEVADTAADAVSTAALAGAISLLLGAVAGWFGGRMGTIEPTMSLPRLGRTLVTNPTVPAPGRANTVVGPQTTSAGGRHSPDDRL